MKLAGSLKSSTEVMKSMGNLIKIPELNKTMMEMSKEMMKAGIIDEMINESIDSALNTDDADIDEVADAEVEKIIFEITQGKLKDLPDISKSNPMSDGAAAASVLNDDLDDEEPEEEMTKRLEALRS